MTILPWVFALIYVGGLGLFAGLDGRPRKALDAITLVIWPVALFMHYVFPGPVFRHWKYTYHRDPNWGTVYRLRRGRKDDDGLLDMVRWIFVR